MSWKQSEFLFLSFPVGWLVFCSLFSIELIEHSFCECTIVDVNAGIVCEEIKNEDIIFYRTDSDNEQRNFDAIQLKPLKVDVVDELSSTISSELDQEKLLRINNWKDPYWNVPHPSHINEPIHFLISSSAIILRRIFLKIYTINYLKTINLFFFSFPLRIYHKKNGMIFLKDSSARKQYSQFVRYPSRARKEMLLIDPLDIKYVYIMKNLQVHCHSELVLYVYNISR